MFTSWYPGKQCAQRLTQHNKPGQGLKLKPSLLDAENFNWVCFISWVDNVNWPMQRVSKSFMFQGLALHQSQCKYRAYYQSTLGHTFNFVWKAFLWCNNFSLLFSCSWLWSTISLCVVLGWCCDDDTVRGAVFRQWICWSTTPGASSSKGQKCLTRIINKFTPLYLGVNYI